MVNGYTGLCFNPGYTIKWDNDKAMFMEFDESDLPYREKPSVIDYPENGKVIENIYQNPELLK